jgi:release factor glutamine methyltransferase
MNFLEALEAAARILRGNPRLDERGSIATESEQLVSGAYRLVTGKSLNRSELLLRAREEYPAPAELERLARRRASGELLQHVLGYQTFLEHEYEVGPEVLIPRPETEVLVSLAIEKLRNPVAGFEVGIGSGAISIELLSRFPSLKMTATELTEVAASRARANARKILTDPSRLEILMAFAEQVLEPFGERGADFLISNPPYLADPNEVDEDVIAHEPHTALFAPPRDPLYFYREIADVRVSRVFLELPHERAEEIRKLFVEKGWRAELHQDLTARDRVLSATR